MAPDLKPRSMRGRLRGKEEEFVENEERGGQENDHGGYGQKPNVLGSEATSAGEGGRAEHRGAYLETDGLGGDVFAEPLRGSGHEGGKDHRQAKTAEGESEWSG